MKISSLSSGQALVGFSALALSVSIASAANFPRVNGYRSEADSPAVAAGLAGAALLAGCATPARPITDTLQPESWSGRLSLRVARRPLPAQAPLRPPGHIARRRRTRAPRGSNRQ